MVIDLDSRGYKAADESTARLEECCKTLFENAVADLAVPATAIDKIIIADEKSFGTRVKEVQTALGRTYGHTDNDVRKAVAKTLPHADTDSAVTNTIIIRDNVFAEVCHTPGGLEFKDRNIDQQVFIYIVYHEVGHCKDNVLRRNIEENAYSGASWAPSTALRDDGS
jgi:hypothetical protein